MEELSKVRVWDPACRSGNFLDVALRGVLDLWKDCIYSQRSTASQLSSRIRFTLHNSTDWKRMSTPTQLASVAVWIGYLQWLNDNGIGWPTESTLRKLDNIQQRDAILAHDVNGEPTETV